MRLHDVAGAVALLSAFQAQAFSCAPTDNQECRLELPSLTVLFDSGIYNFDGDSQLSGSDGQVIGYTAGTGAFPELVPTHTASRAGFSFVPTMQAEVGGSGVDGTHEASASFAFSALQFIARPGWRIDAITFEVDGTRYSTGNGSVALNLPGAALATGAQSFTSSGVFAPTTANFAASFGVGADYLEGEDGTAASFGTAGASFTAVRLLAHVSAVPEPSTPALWLLGAAGLGLIARRSRAAPAR